jgi:tetratricopeptide (TPR) repeat protein
MHRILTLIAAAALVAAGCTQTTVTTRPVQDTDIKEGPSRIVDASELDEEEGVLSKPAEPEKAAQVAPAGQTAPEAAGQAPYNPSVQEADEKTAKAEEMETPLFQPKRTADEVDPKEAEKLMEEMKREILEDEEARAKKTEGLLKEVRNSGSSEDRGEQAAAKFEEAEKLYSEKKFKEAAEAYRAVLELVPTHEGARERLTQCYRDIEEEGERAKEVKLPATAQEMLLLEQKFASAVRLYDDGEKDAAFEKFKEVVEMVEWSRTQIDTKNILDQARDYVERIKIEKELAGKAVPKEEQEDQNKQAPPEEEKKPPEEPAGPKEPEKPEQPKEPQQPGPGGIAPH